MQKHARDMEGYGGRQAGAIRRTQTRSDSSRHTQAHSLALKCNQTRSEGAHLPLRAYVLHCLINGICLTALRLSRRVVQHVRKRLVVTLLVR